MKAVFSLHNETSVVINETIIAFLCMIAITAMFQFCSLDLRSIMFHISILRLIQPLVMASHLLGTFLKKLLHRYSSLFCKNVEGGGGVIYSDVKYVVYV